MANTTNYNWETPDDTDLVKDGAAAIRTLGNSIDTTTKNLNPETTTGDIAYRSATANTNTRLAIGTTGQVLTVAAGVPSWASPSDQTPLTTKGDVFTFSTVDARLGVGANGTILTADSAEATGLKWAAPAAGGAYTELASGSLTGASVALTSISADYKDLLLIIRNYRPVNDGNGLNMRFNNDTADRYRYQAASTDNVEFAIGYIRVTADQDNTTSNSLYRIEMNDYANTSTWKMAEIFGISNNQTTSSNYNSYITYGYYNQTGAINRIDLSPSGSNFNAGTYILYGVK